MRLSSSSAIIPCTACGTSRRTSWITRSAWAVVWTMMLLCAAAKASPRSLRCCCSVGRSRSSSRSARRWCSAAYWRPPSLARPLLGCRRPLCRIVLDRGARQLVRYLIEELLELASPLLGISSLMGGFDPQAKEGRGSKSCFVPSCAEEENRSFNVMRGSQSN